MPTSSLSTTVGWLRNTGLTVPKIMSILISIDRLFMTSKCTSVPVSSGHAVALLTC